MYDLETMGLTKKQEAMLEVAELIFSVINQNGQD